MSKPRGSADGPGIDLEQRMLLLSSIDTRTGAGRTDALASVTRRLYDDYHEQATLMEVVSTVCRCRRELDIVVDASLPEMVERLARQRLTDRRAAGREEMIA